MLQHLTQVFWFRGVAVTVIAAFLLMIPAQSGFAQVAAVLPVPGSMVHVSGAFQPANISGMKVDFKDPFNFYFIMDNGQQVMTDEVKKSEFEKIIKYFMASLTTPNKDMWVNLSPLESSRVIPENFSRTALGRDLLAQDYLLKQMTASLIYPEDAIGKKFWEKVYAQAYEKFGTTDIPVDTFNKVWITPDTADVYQKDDTVLVVDSHLKVILETDYLATSTNAMPTRGHDAPPADTNERGFVSPSRLPTSQPTNTKATQVSTQTPNDPASTQPNPTLTENNIAKNILREIVIPVIEKEVNEGAHFAATRQAYNAMILATWFKKSLKDSLLGQAYADQDKSNGIAIADPQLAKEEIYNKYLEAFKVGVFNYIKDEADSVTDDSLPRKYFSGGYDLGEKVAPQNVLMAAARRVWGNKNKLAGLTFLSVLLMAPSAFGRGAEDLMKHSPDNGKASKVAFMGQPGKALLRAGDIRQGAGAAALQAAKSRASSSSNVALAAVQDAPATVASSTGASVGSTTVVTLVAPGPTGAGVASVAHTTTSNALAVAVVAPQAPQATAPVVASTPAVVQPEASNGAKATTTVSVPDQGLSDDILSLKATVQSLNLENAKLAGLQQSIAAAPSDGKSITNLIINVSEVQQEANRLIIENRQLSEAAINAMNQASDAMNQAAYAKKIALQVSANDQEIGKITSIVNKRNEEAVEALQAESAAVYRGVLEALSRASNSLLAKVSGQAAAAPASALSAPFSFDGPRVPPNLAELRVGLTLAITKPGALPEYSFFQQGAGAASAVVTPTAEQVAAQKEIERKLAESQSVLEKVKAEKKAIEAGYQDFREKYLVSEEIRRQKIEEQKILLKEAINDLADVKAELAEARNAVQEANQEVTTQGKAVKKAAQGVAAPAVRAWDQALIDKLAKEYVDEIKRLNRDIDKAKKLLNELKSNRALDQKMNDQADSEVAKLVGAITGLVAFLAYFMNRARINAVLFSLKWRLNIVQDRKEAIDKSLEAQKVPDRVAQARAQGFLAQTIARFRDASRRVWFARQSVERVTAGMSAETTAKLKEVGEEIAVFKKQLRMYVRSNNKYPAQSQAASFEAEKALFTEKISKAQERRKILLNLGAVEIDIAKAGFEIEAHARAIPGDMDAEGIKKAYEEKRIALNTTQYELNLRRLNLCISINEQEAVKAQERVEILRTEVLFKKDRSFVESAVREVQVRLVEAEMHLSRLHEEYTRLNEALSLGNEIKEGDVSAPGRTDPAAIAGKTDAAADLGGINLGSDTLKINIRFDGKGLPLPLKMQDPAMINLSGLMPFIKEMTPVTQFNVPVLNELIRGQK
ncbi:MAG: hypothetical protein HQL20_06710 [Candidatus Omnitrophica bacterium]|nr:hypothetical protein [Candidatus Omnitrophota bacterium]